MTNEEDNDQFTNDQLTETGGSARPWRLLLFGYRNLVIGHFSVIGIWSLVIVLSSPVFP